MAGLFVVLHTGVDGAGAVELFGQHQAGQLVGQCDASHADASLCGFLNAVVQPVGGTDDKGEIPGSAAGTLRQQGGVMVNEEKVESIDASYTAEQLKEGLKIRKGKKVYHKALLK